VKIFSLLAATGMCAFGLANIDFTVRVMPSAKTFAVKMQIDNAKELEKIRIPAWCPGFYFLLDYDKKISDFNATDAAGNRIRARKESSNTWVVENPTKKPLTITYRVLGDDTGLGFFRSHIRDTSAFINGPAVFMYADGHMTEKQTARFAVPSGWEIATSMELSKDGYSAQGYDELVDHPVQMGRFFRRKFTVDNIPFEAIWVGDPKPNCNIDEETERLRLGSAPAIKMMGDVPFKHYTYILHLEVGDFAGGLEHRASTCIAVANSQTVHLDDLATHEYFHAWNVKQLRPEILGPFDYSAPNRTGNLWFSEGTTDYYAKVHAYQAKFFSRSQFLSQLENSIEELQMSKTRMKLTIEEVSKQAWENGGFGVGDLSYYTKGLIISLLLDAKLRSDSGGKKTLDELMRTMYTSYRLPKTGFSENGIREALVKLGGDSMGPFYDKMIRTKDEMPYDELTKIGLRFMVPGGKYLELPYVTDENEIVTAINRNAQDSGLQLKDQIVSVTEGKDDKIEVNYLREKKEMQALMTGRRFTAGDYRLRVNPFATKSERQRLTEWLAR
jgi:predicted metalloprotease with PDZ domain